MLENDGITAESHPQAGRDLSEIYKIKSAGNKIRIESPTRKKITVGGQSNSVFSAISTFAPDGIPTLDPRNPMAFVELATGRQFEFPAGEAADIAAVFAAFCVGQSKPIVSESESMAPLPASVFDVEAGLPDDVPDWIKQNEDFKPSLVVDDGRIVLAFAPLRIGARSKYQIEGKVGDGKPADYWGYEVTADGNPFGWVALMEPGAVLLTGIEGVDWSKHRSIRAAMFRISSHFAAYRSK